MARGSRACGTSRGVSACWAGIWKARATPSTTETPKISSRVAKPPCVAATSKQCHRSLRRHAGGEDAAPVQPVGDMAGGQGHHQRGHELEQPDQAQVPGAGSDVVHVPGHGHHQHLVGGDAAQARQPEAHELALGQQAGRGSVRHRSSLAAPGRPWPRPRQHCAPPHAVARKPIRGSPDDLSGRRSCWRKPGQVALTVRETDRHESCLRALLRVFLAGCDACLDPQPSGLGIEHVLVAPGL